MSLVLNQLWYQHSDANEAWDLITRLTTAHQCLVWSPLSVIVSAVRVGCVADTMLPLLIWLQWAARSLAQQSGKPLLSVNYCSKYREWPDLMMGSILKREPDTGSGPLTQTKHISKSINWVILTSERADVSVDNTGHLKSLTQIQAFTPAQTREKKSCSAWKVRALSSVSVGVFSFDIFYSDSCDM